MSNFLIAKHDDKSFSVLNMDKVGTLTFYEESIYYILEFQQGKSGTLIDVVTYSFCSGKEIGDRIIEMKAKYKQKEGNIFSGIEIKGINT